MYIEKIELMGFRSFRAGTVEDLTRGVNIIVGPNGSGKSTVVAALEFVLTRNNVRLGERMRQLFLCNVVAGQQKVTSAAVTVWLNNDDGRFPFKETHISVRRVVSSLSDQYFVNDRHIKVDQFLGLLETAGFSPNNSHFLVQQGFVKEVAFGSPVAMLNILRGISGAETFEERKGKAIALIGDCEQAIKRLDNQIGFLGDQMRLFHIDRTAVAQFQEAMKVRRFLSGRIAQLNCMKIQEEITQAKEEQRTLKISLEEEEFALETTKQDLEAKAAELKEAKAIEVRSAEEQRNLEELCNWNQTIIEELTEQMAELAELSQNVDELPAKKEVKKQKLEELGEVKALLETADSEIAGKEATLAELEATRKQMIMLGKLLVGSDNGKDAVERRLREMTAEKTQQEKYLADVEAKLEEASVDSSQESISKLGKEIASLNEAVSALKCKKNDHHSERRKIMSETSGLQRKLLDTDSTLRKTAATMNVFSGNTAIRSREIMRSLVDWCKQQLETMMDVDEEMDEDDDYEGSEERFQERVNRRAERASLQSIVNGYHGQFIDVMTIDPDLGEDEKASIYRAIETLLGTKIFQHIVASDAVASTILKYLQRLKTQDKNGAFKDGCSLRFVCLDRAAKLVEDERASGRAGTAWVNEDPTVQQLIGFLATQEETEPAVEYICRRLFIANSFDRAGQLATRHSGCDFVTLQGEKIGRRGIISFTPLESRRRTKLQWAELYLQLTTETSRLKAHLTELAVAYEEASSAVKRASVEVEKSEEEIRRKTELLKNANKLKTKYQREEHLEACQAEVTAARAKLASITAEVAFWQQQAEKSEVDASALEEETFSQAAAASELKKELAQMKKERGGLVNRKNRLTAEISALELAINGLFTAKIKLANKRKDSERLGEQKAVYEAKAVEYDTAVKAGRAALAELQTRVSTLSAQKEALDEQLLATERKVDEVEQRSRLLSDQIADLEPKAQLLQLEAENCGAFGRSRGQRDLFARFANHNYSDLSRDLQAVNRKLNKFSKDRLTEEVVRRFDDIVVKMEELEELRERSAANVVGISDIVALIEARKHEIIDRTYKQVNRYIQEIFHQLVPGGVIRLQFMVKATGGQAGGNRRGRPRNQAEGGGVESDSASIDSILQSPSRAAAAQSKPVNDSSSLSSSQTNGTQQSSSLDLARKLMDSLPTEERYEGMEIVVNFAGGSGEPLHRVDALSGGQKTLVSLAFIFALQKVDPTPFYIFDEVDANLDDSKRGDFARLVKQVADKESRQFILTSFYRQTVEQGDKFYGVSNVNRLSKIKPIERAEALEFIELGNAEVSAAAGQASTFATTPGEVTMEGEFASSAHQITAADVEETSTHEGGEPAGKPTSPVVNEPMEQEEEQEMSSQI